MEQLEEALLRADVGIGVTSQLLDDLRIRVKAKEIDSPDELLDALRQDGWSRVSATNLRPARFGSVDGLRFDADMTADNGLMYRGTFGAAERKDRLTLFFWMAPVEYYHGRDVAAVERMFQSIRFVDD